MMKIICLISIFCLLSGCRGQTPLSLAEYCEIKGKKFSKKDQKRESLCLNSIAVCTEQELGDIFYSASPPCDLREGTVSKSCEVACKKLEEQIRD
jgi:hypothetical protein